MGETGQEWDWGKLAKNGIGGKAMVVRENKISREGRSRKKNQLRFGQKERGGGRRKGMREREREGEGERERQWLVFLSLPPPFFHELVISGCCLVMKTQSRRSLSDEVFGAGRLFPLFISLLNDNPQWARPAWDGQSRTILFAINFSL